MSEDLIDTFTDLATTFGSTTDSAVSWIRLNCFVAMLIDQRF
jgi:hypothetical protein